MMIGIGAKDLRSGEKDMSAALLWAKRRPVISPIHVPRLTPAARRKHVHVRFFQSKNEATAGTMAEGAANCVLGSQFQATAICANPTRSVGAMNGTADLS